MASRLGILPPTGGEQESLHLPRDDSHSLSLSLSLLVNHRTDQINDASAKEKAGIMFPATIKSLWVVNVEQHFVITFIVSLTHLYGRQYFGILNTV